MKTSLKIVLIIIAILLFVKFVPFKKDKWMGFYYIHGDLTNDINSGELPSLESCREWIADKASENDPDGNYDYECGKNCKLQDFTTRFYICDETVE